MEKKENKGIVGNVEDPRKGVIGFLTTGWKFKYAGPVEKTNNLYHNEFRKRLEEKNYFKSPIIQERAYFQSQVKGSAMLSLEVYKIEDSHLIEEYFYPGKNTIERNYDVEITLYLKTQEGLELGKQHNRLRKELNEIIQRDKK